MKSNKRRVYFLVSAISFLIAVFFALYRKIYEFVDLKTLMGTLSDSFLVPGVFIGGIGLISWVGRFGFFDMLAYGSRSFFGHFIHSLSDDLPKNFYEFKEKKDEKGRRWLKEFVIVGAACLLLSLVLLVIYLLVS